jgi:hypothetical protein
MPGGRAGNSIPELHTAAMIPGWNTGGRSWVNAAPVIVASRYDTVTHFRRPLRTAQMTRFRMPQPTDVEIPDGAH